MKRALMVIAVPVLLLVLTSMLAASAFAQDTPPDSPDPGGVYSPVPSVCRGEEVELGAAEPIPECPGIGSGTLDALPYIVPCENHLTPEDTPCAISATAMGPGFSWIGAVNNSVYGYVHPDGTRYVIQQSNDKRLTYRVDRGAGVISIMEDTTWANAEACTDAGPGVMAAGRQYTGNSPGMGLWKTQYQGCGDIKQVSGNIRAVQYIGAILENPMAPANECAAPHEGAISNSHQLIWQGTAICNGVRPIDMMVLWNRDGAGAGEVFVHCKDRGLCAWYQSIDWTQPGAQPADWDENTDLCGGLGQQQFGENIMCVPGETTTDKIVMPMDLTRQFDIAASIFSVDYFIDIAGQLWPGTNEADTSFEQPEGKLSIFASQVQDATYLPLNTVFHQEETTHFETPQFIQMTSRLCGNISGESDNPAENHDIDVPSEVTTKQGNDDVITRLTAEGSERASAMFAKHRKTEQNYDKPTLVLDPVTALGCNVETPNKALLDDKDKGARDHNEFLERPGDVFDPTATLFNITITITDALCSVLGNLPIPLLECKPNAELYARGTYLNPYAADQTCHYAGCEVSEIDRINYINKAEYSDRGGLVETYKSYFQQYAGGLHGQQPQTYYNTVTSENAGRIDGADIALHTRKKQENAGEFFNCALVPIEVQNSTQFQQLNLGAECNRDFRDQNALNSVPTSEFVESDYQVGPLDEIIDITAQCTVDNGIIDRVANAVEPWFGKWGAQGAANLRALWQNVSSLATKGSTYMNPALALAMWIEETAASGVHDLDSWAVGCRGDLNTSYAASHPFITLSPGQASDASIVSRHLDDQMDCLQRFVTSKYNSGSTEQEKIDNYMKFVCHWAIGNPNCNPSSVASVHARVLQWYKELVGTCGVIDTSSATL